MIFFTFLFQDQPLFNCWEVNLGLKLSRSLQTLENYHLHIYSLRYSLGCILTCWSTIARWRDGVGQVGRRVHTPLPQVLVALQLHDLLHRLLRSFWWCSHRVARGRDSRLHIDCWHFRRNRFQHLGQELPREWELGMTMN